MTRIKRSFVLFLVTMTLGATYGGGCSLLGRQIGATQGAAPLVLLQ